MDLLCVTQEGPQTTRSFQWRSQRATEVQCFASETWKKARTSREQPDTETRQ